MDTAVFSADISTDRPYSAPSDKKTKTDILIA
jgi:hypothetical protein